MSASTNMAVETGRVIASCFALAAFAVSVLTGLAENIEAAQILLRAVIAMIVCFPVGAMVGVTCDSVIRSHLSAKSSDVQGAAPAAPSVEALEQIIEVSPAEPAAARATKARAAA